MPSSSASVNLTPGRLVAVVVQDLVARAGGLGGVVEPFRDRGDLGILVRRRAVTRWAGYGATSAGQTMPFSSWWASTMQATLRPSPMPYEPMTIGMGLAVLAQVGRAERDREVACRA